MYLLPRLQVLAHVQAMLLNNQELWFENEGIFPDDKTQAGYPEYLIGCLFDANGDLDAAEYWINEAYKQRQHNGPANAPLYVANRLASVLLQKGNSKAVEDLLLPLVEIGEDRPATSTDSINLLTSHRYLARALQEQGNYPGAEAKMRTVLRARQNLLGYDHENALVIMTELAVLLYVQNKNEALELSEEVLGLTQSISQKQGARNEKLLINARHAVCLALYNLKRFGRAEEMALQNLEEQEKKHHGISHPLVLQTKSLLAKIYSATGRLSDAEKLLREVLMFRQTQLGQNHPGTLNTMKGLASLMAIQGNFEAAKAMYTTTIKLMQTVLGEDHRQTLDAIGNFALLLERHQQYKSATKWYLLAINGAKNSPNLGPADKMTLSLKLRLASTLYRSGKREEATLLERENLEIATSSMLPHDPKLMDYRNAYALTLYHLERYLEAADVAKELIDIAKEYLEPEDPKHLVYGDDYIASLYNLGRVQEVVDLQKEAVTLAERILDPKDISLFIHQCNYARILEDLQQYEEAEKFYKRSENGWDKVAAPDDASLLECKRDRQENLAKIKESRRKLPENL